MKYTYDKDICANCGSDKVYSKWIHSDKKPPNIKVIKCKDCEKIWTIKI